MNQNNIKTASSEKQTKKSGGLYADVKISPKAADALVILSTSALAMCLAAAIFFS